MKNNKNTVDPFENEPDFLAQFDKKTPFSVPDHYFESLPEVINDKILKKKSLKFGFDKMSYRILGPSAALIALFFVVFHFYNTPSGNTVQPEEFSDALLNEVSVELDDYMIYDVYAEIIEETESSTEQTSGNETENDEYIDYLLENDIDINTIIEEL
ncbi:MAG: hypothetical protein KDD41_09455 [Flavobacteriales bacterium]|nr:hypothetical protein [Flavobacteriales bacterium]